ncbi:MAG: DUF4058 family protein [Gemmataceae bacterium]
MPSPFPGMDPYLEGRLWTSFHAQLGAQIARQLVPKLRPRYFALAEKRYVIEAVPHVWVEVRDVEHERLVTAIEILSPTNKGTGRDEYLEKRAEYLHGPAHLMEIDLTREGQRIPVRKPLPTAPYFVFLSRVGRRPMMDVWPIAWDQRLPTVPVPLLPGDADVPLDLQDAFDRVYDEAGFDLAAHYNEGPTPPLPRELRGWATKRVSAWRRNR